MENSDKSIESSNLTADVLLDVSLERLRQNNKFGIQDLAMLSQIPNPQDVSYSLMSDHYGIAVASRAKYNCDNAFENNIGTWFHVLVEEVAESMEAAYFHGDISKELEEELIQTAAVAIAMVEHIRKERIAIEATGKSSRAADVI